MEITTQRYEMAVTPGELMTIKCALDALIEARDGDNEAESMRTDISAMLGF